MQQYVQNIQCSVFGKWALTKIYSKIVNRERRALWIRYPGAFWNFIYASYTNFHFEHISIVCRDIDEKLFALFARAFCQLPMCVSCELTLGHVQYSKCICNCRHFKLDFVFVSLARLQMKFSEIHKILFTAIGNPWHGTTTFSNRFVYLVGLVFKLEILKLLIYF